MAEMEKEGRPPENKRSRKPAHPVKREINEEMKVRDQYCTVCMRFTHGNGATVKACDVDALSADPRSFVRKSHSLKYNVLNGHKPDSCTGFYCL